jgi:hypothetical protein
MITEYFISEICGTNNEVNPTSDFINLTTDFRKFVLECFSYDSTVHHGVIGETFRNKLAEILQSGGDNFIGIRKLNVIKNKLD